MMLVGKPGKNLHGWVEILLQKHFEVKLDLNLF